jgi:hypothetical protein
MQQKAANAKQKEYNKKLKLKDEYDELYAKMQAVWGLNLPPERWNWAQL